MLSCFIYGNSGDSEDAYIMDRKLNYLENIKYIYKQYIEDALFVYTWIKESDGYIVVLKKIIETKTTENRTTAKQMCYSLYRGNKFYVELIFHKFNPIMTISKISCYFFEKKITFEVGKIVEINHFDEIDLYDNIFDMKNGGIPYYKNIEPAFYNGLDVAQYKKYDITLIKKWDIHGLLEELLYFKKGKLHGVYTKFKNDIKIEKINYEHGLKHGKTIFYYDAGNYQYVENYKSGLLDGMCTTYYPTGQIESECKYIKNKKNGQCRHYYVTGKLKLISVYENDILTDCKIKYYDSGNIEYEEYYNNSGNAHGTWMAFYCNRNIKHEKKFNNGKMTGLWKLYYPDGTLHVKIDYDKLTKKIYGSIDKDDIYF